VSPADLAAPLGLASVIALGGLSPFMLAPLATALAPGALAGVMRSSARIAEDVAMALGRFAQVCLVLLMLGMLSVVLLRYVFGESLTRLSEAVMYAHALGFLMAGPAALVGNAHVRVDVLYERAPIGTKAWIDVLGFTVFLAPAMILLLVYAGPVVDLAWRVVERSNETDGLPLVWALKTAIPVFAVAMIAAGVAHAGRAALRIHGLDERPELAAPQDSQHTHAGATP
jgi:TRAP-type mannitol/chloroaromatic compound transport system permease small subunit